MLVLALQSREQAEEWLKVQGAVCFPRLLPSSLPRPGPQRGGLLSLEEQAWLGGWGGGRGGERGSVPCTQLGLYGEMDLGPPQETDLRLEAWVPPSYLNPLPCLLQFYSPAHTSPGMRAEYPRRKLILSSDKLILFFSFQERRNSLVVGEIGILTMSGYEPASASLQNRAPECAPCDMCRAKSFSTWPRLLLTVGSTLFPFYR